MTVLNAYALWQLGRMYYLNRKTMKKSWERPKPKEGQGTTLNLELNICTTTSSIDSKASPFTFEDDTKSKIDSSISSGNHMVAVPCVNCHLLVMLHKSSPACPNCRFVQPSVPVMLQTPPRRLDAIKPQETLSLLH
jgi:hypothetical protein